MVDSNGGCPSRDSTNRQPLWDIKGKGGTLSELEKRTKRGSKQLGLLSGVDNKKSEVKWDSVATTKRRGGGAGQDPE